MLRRLALAAVILIAAAPPPPAVLEPYIRNGRFDPGDYGWMRGRFADATPRQKADALAIDDWLQRCAAAERARAQAELVAAGVTPSASLTINGDRDPMCDAVAFTPHPPAEVSYARFAQALPRARTIADTCPFAIALADAQDSTERRAQLVLRLTGDQMLRGAFPWGQGGASAAPAIDPVERLIVVTRMAATATTVPQPLEDAATVAPSRQRAGLKPLADYLADMDRLVGPCPPDVISPSPARR